MITFMRNLFKKNQTGLVFIIGAPRSGTTWLWGLLTSFSNATPLLKEDFNSSEKTKWGNKFKTSETGCFINYDDVYIKKIIKNKQAKFPTKIIVEKTPLHILHIERILKLFPNAKIIYIQRDPRAVISSMLFSNFFNFANSLNDAIKKYDSYIRAILPFLKNKNIYTIKYEDLLNNTKQELEKILNFTNIKYSSKNINKAIRENDKQTKVAIPGVFRIGTVDGYKNDLTPDQILYIEQNLKNIFEKFYSD